MYIYIYIYYITVYTQIIPVVKQRKYIMTC